MPRGAAARQCLVSHFAIIQASRSSLRLGTLTTVNCSSRLSVVLNAALLESLPHRPCPLLGGGWGVEPVRHQQLAASEDPYFDAQTAIVEELAAEVGTIRFADQLEQQLAGLRLATWGLVVRPRE